MRRLGRRPATVLAALLATAAAMTALLDGPAPERAAAADADTGLLGATAAAVLPVTVVGDDTVVSAALARRLARVGGRDVARAGGVDRYATAVAVSAASHPAGAAQVVLASGAGFPDALVAGPVAAALGAPLLLVPPAALPPVVAAELARLGPDRITVVGGTGVVADAVAAAARTAAGGAAVTVRRLAGADRFATAVAAARTFAPGVRGVVLATGRDFPDGVAATPLAAALGGPVLLTEPAALPAPVRAELVRLRPARLVVAGGTGAVSPAVAAQAQAATGRTAERAAGTDRFATAAALAALTAAVRPVRGAFVATGLAFPDALAGGVAAAHARAAVLLTDRTPRREAAAAAEVARLRGVGSWVQLTLDMLTWVRTRANTWHTAYVRAYTADALARLYGWGDAEVGAELAALRAARKPGGGYGLDQPYDTWGDGTVNPVTSQYLVTITDHAGRALIDGLRAGAVPAAEVAAQVDIVLGWPRIAGDPGCLAYSDTPYDRRWCIYNASSGAGWFLRAAWDLGVHRPGQLELAAAIAAHDADAYLGAGWWPYTSRYPTTPQDLNHDSWTVEAHLTLNPDLGAEALAAVLAGGLFHPDPAVRNWDDPMGYLRLVPYDCTKQAGVDAAVRQVAAHRSLADTPAQLALWAARTAEACGA